MESYAHLTDVLRTLVRAHVFKWEEKHQEAFEALKNALSADTVLAYFDPAADHEVHVDGCPLGISATLVQRSPNEDHWRVVQYASRALSDAERRYSQIELETLAADFLRRKFHVFLYGKPFIVVTDHKPLEVIFNNPRHATSIRLQRMTVRMLDYEFKVEYRPGKTNISDYTSRHPLPLEQSGKRELGTTKDVRHYVNFVTENVIPKAISKEEIIVSTGNDRELQKLIKCVEEKSIDHKDADLRKYSNVFNELAVVDGLVLRGERIVVPQTLREAMVTIAHEGHQGIVRTMQLLRAHVWFPGMDTMVEKHVGKCLACQSTTPCHTREPLQMTDLPRGPWQKVSVDFAGPLRNKDMALVFWDQYARYPFVEFTSSTFADYVIPLFTRVFNTYGIPEEIKSDNGPPFNGSKFANFAQEQGFRHRKVTPGWAEANGDVERFMQTLKKSARISKLEGKAIREGVQITVGSYRAKPHPATKESPDMLMFGRELRRKLPERIVPTGEIPYDQIRQRDAAKKKQMKEYADKRRNAR